MEDKMILEPEVQEEQIDGTEIPPEEEITVSEETLAVSEENIKGYTYILQTCRCMALPGYLKKYSNKKK